MPKGFYGDSKAKKPKLEKVKRIKEEKIKEKKNKHYQKIINIIFAIILIFILLITIDIIAVSKFNVGPFFAIKTKEYHDGGTKEYYGFLYKVIKYNQKIGRKDTEIGGWDLKYYIDPIDYTTLDLALDLNNDPKNNYSKIYKKFLRVSGTVLEANAINNEIILQYKDEDNDYTLNVTCKMWSSENNLSNYKKGDNTIVLGTVTNYKMTNGNTPNTLTMNNCFVK